MNTGDIDYVNHPSHYTRHPSGIECIQITEHMGFNLGNALKYIWRAEEKGTVLQDLEKARWYINREIALRSAKAQLGSDDKRNYPLDRTGQSSGLSPLPLDRTGLGSVDKRNYPPEGT